MSPHEAFEQLEGDANRRERRVQHLARREEHASLLRKAAKCRLMPRALRMHLTDLGGAGQWYQLP